jgi:hypothetical protein
VLPVKSAISTTLLLLLLASATCAQETHYFPNQALDHEQGLDDFAVGWYSKHLKAMGEPSLLELSKTPAHVYRFLWLRSFHNPVAVRLNVDRDGTSLLTVKVTNGRGGYAPGELVKNESRRLSKEYTQGFLDDVRELGYWSLPTDDPENRGTDGAEWILEAVKDGRYKLVVRWSPEKGAVRTLGLAMMIRLAELKLLYQEVY